MTTSRPIPGLLRSFSALTVAAALTSLAHAADWSDWRAMPDSFQGKVAFRFAPTGKKAGYEYQLRNGYDQKVTIKLLVAGTDEGGAAVSGEQTIALDQGVQSATPAGQKVVYKSMTSVALRAIMFTAAKPKPTAGGFYVPNSEIPALEKAIAQAEKNLKDADHAASAANQAQASVRAQVGSGKGDTSRGGGDERIGATGVGSVVSGQSGATRSAETALKVQERVVQLKKQLAAAKEADVIAQADAEKRAQAALASGESTVPPATVAGVSAAPPTTTESGVSPLTLAKPTLSVDQMKGYSKQAKDALNKKDWPGVEASLKPLLAGSGNAIKDKDRADLYFKLGTAYDNDNKPADAETAYSEAIRLGKQDESLYNNLATVQYSASKFAEAEVSEQAAIKLKSDDASYYFNLGLICAAQNKNKEAEAAYRNALRLDPNNEQIKTHLTDIQKVGK